MTGWEYGVAAFMVCMLLWVFACVVITEYQESKQRKLRAVKDSQDRIWKSISDFDDAILRINDQLSGHRERIFKLEYRLHNR